MFLSLNGALRLQLQSSKHQLLVTETCELSSFFNLSSAFYCPPLLVSSVLSGVASSLLFHSFVSATGGDNGDGEREVDADAVGYRYLFVGQVFLSRCCALSRSGNQNMLLKNHT
jgi:hypothetical protein